MIHLSRIKSVQKSPSSVTNYPILSKQVDVAPGATTRVSLGGTGRPIVGKLNAPAEIAGRVDWNQSDNSLILKATPDNMFSSAWKKMMGTPAVAGHTPSCSTRTAHSGSRTWRPALMT